MKLTTVGKIASYLHHCEELMKKFIEEAEEGWDGLLSSRICQCIECVDSKLNLAVKLERKHCYEHTCSDEEFEDIEQGDPNEIDSDESGLKDEDGISEQYYAPDYADCSKPLFMHCHSLWKKHKHKLLHLYSRTVYCLSPYPLIIEHAKHHLSLEDFETMD